MSRYKLDNPEEASAQLASKFKVVVEFIIEAESADDATIDVNDIIQEGIIALLDSEEEREPIDSYDITEVDPAELF